MLVRYQNIRPHDLKKACKNTFKHMCSVQNHQILNFKFIEETICQDKINYMKGNKKDAKKQGVEHTIKYRQENKLKEFYESNPPLSCRVAQIVD